MTTVSNRTSINRKTLSGLQDINVDSLGTTSAQIGDILIQNDTISGVDTIYFQDGVHTASIGLDVNGDLLIDGTGELHVTTNGIDMNGESINMTGGRIHNIPLIESKNNENLVIEGRGTGNIVLQTDTGHVQITDGLSVQNTATMGNIFSSGVGTFAGMYSTTLQASTATFGSCYATTLSANIGSFSGLTSNTLSSSIGTFGTLNTTTFSSSIGSFAGLSVSGQTTLANIRSLGVATFGNMFASSATFNNIRMNPIAIGVGAGQISQGLSGISIGVNAGNQTQATNAIAIGESAGNFSQRSGAIAIGNGAGFQQQGTNAIAIGNSAGDAFQHQNSIIINATNSYIDSTAQSAAYIAPLRSQKQSNFIGYNTSTYEVSYFPTATNSFTFGGLASSTLQASTATFGTMNTTTLSASIGSFSGLNVSGQATMGNIRSSGVSTFGSMTAGSTSLTANLALNDNELRLRSSTDANHALRYCGSSSTFAGQNLDGPVLYGWANGGLGTTNGGQKLALTWNSNQDSSFNGWLAINGKANWPSVQDKDTLQLGGGIKFNNTNFYPTLTGNNYSHMYVYSGRRDPCAQFTVPLPVNNAGGFIMVSYWNNVGNWASAQGVCRANNSPALQNNGSNPGIQGYWNGGQAGIVFFGTAVNNTGYVCVTMITDGQFD